MFVFLSESKKKSTTQYILSYCKVRLFICLDALWWREYHSPPYLVNVDNVQISEWNSACNLVRNVVQATIHPILVGTIQVRERFGRLIDKYEDEVDRHTFQGVGRHFVIDGEYDVYSLDIV